MDSRPPTNMTEAESKAWTIGQIKSRKLYHTDAFAVEGSDFSQFDATAQTWNQVGDIVDGNGNSPNCEWDKENGGC